MNRLIHVRFLIALSIVAGFAALGFGTTHLMTVRSEAATTPAGKPAVFAADTIPTLPTVVVRANTDIPTLPVVVVTPGTEQKLAAVNSARLTSAQASSGSVSPLMYELLPHVRLDMPYYSFGKTMPRAIKD